MMTRDQAVEVAKTWLGTPYAIRGRVKHGGCDCATLLTEYLVEIGATTQDTLPAYHQDWFLHTSDNRYLLGIMKNAVLTAETICRGTIDAKPGDILLFRHLKKLSVYTHGAIVLDFPTIIHAVDPKVSIANANSHRLTGFKPVAIFSPWKEDAHV